MIEVKNLVKQYGSFLAVDHLDFTIERGSIYGFLGPNGAGKSTTMNMITGYLPPTSGTVLIDGFDICEEPEEARRRIEALMGDVPRVELFARRPAPGWDVWGNEVESTVDWIPV